MPIGGIMNEVVTMVETVMNDVIKYAGRNPVVTHFIGSCNSNKNIAATYLSNSTPELQPI